jgi:tetratricopeptide (TPR) repeat protein
MKRTLLFALGAVILLAGCASQHEYYLVGNDSQNDRIAHLFRTLDREHPEPRRRANIIEQIATTLLEAGATDRFRTLLTTEVEKQPQNPYNAYYLLLVAQNYEKESVQMALHYYRRIIRNFSDVTVRGTSVHYASLSSLANYTEDPSLRIHYYSELIRRFPERIDLGKTHYFMAKTYEKLGRWDEAYDSYKEFIDYPDTDIPGKPLAHREVQAMVDFYDSSKDWTMDSLDRLVAGIKQALWRQNPNRLLRYRAKENFFAMSWQQDKYDFNSQITFNLGIFLQRSRVHFAEDLEINSNAREAYLRTWGWSYRIPTWYLYFRRVDFPANPEINGDWEWAGIYFGESL